MTDPIVTSQALRSTAATKLRRFAAILIGEAEPATATESGQALALMWIVLVPAELILKMFPDHTSEP